MTDWIGTVSTGRTVLLLFVATQIIYLAMLLFTLPHLQHLAGGMKPFDLLPQGYDSVYAGNFMEAIGPEGRRFYLTRQIPLDLVYPALFAMAFAVMWVWLLNSYHCASGRWRWVALLPVIAGLADYVENGLIATMLNTYPDMSDAVVATASLATMLKSTATAVYFVALLSLLVAVGVQRYRISKG